MYWVVQTTQTIGKEVDPMSLFDDLEVKVIQNLKTPQEAKAAMNEVYKEITKEEGGYKVDFSETLEEIKVIPLSDKTKVITISIVEQI